MTKKVAIIGVGLTPTRTRHKDLTHPELTFMAVRNALEDAGITIEDIDAFVYGSMDPFDGIVAPEKWDMDAVGGAMNKPVMKISTGGTTGISTALAGYYHVASGMFDVVMAVATQRVGMCIDAQQVLNTCVCPIFERSFGGNAIAVGALQAMAHMAKYGTTEEDLARVAVKNRKNALNNPYAHLKLDISIEDALSAPIVVWPLRLLDCCPRSDGSCALIFATEEKVKEFGIDNPAWVKAVGYIADNYYWGDRPWYHFWDSLAMLARRVYKMAKIHDPLKEIDVAELYEAFTIQEILEYEALGFAKPGEGPKLLKEGITYMDGELPVNPSGGVLSTNPIGASALIRVAEAALQVMGKAGKRQVPDVETALAHGWGGTAQYHGLMVLTREKP